MDKHKYYLYFLTEKRTAHEQNALTFVIIL